MLKYLMPTITDIRGSLVAIEENRNVPFIIKRIYYMYNLNDNTVRGCHAHKKLEQVLLCIKGNCSISLDDGHEKEIVIISEPNVGLYLPPRVWHQISEISEGAIILVLASEHYNESDYIRDYDDFLDYISSINGGIQ